jgi:hypothetical protein
MAVAIVFMILVGTVAAQQPFEHLYFTTSESAHGTEYRLGANAFTVAQLGYFLASIEKFLLLADTVSAGAQITLRQNGERGYIALTAYDAEEAPFYVLTLAAEEPTGIRSRSGLQALWVLLAEQLPEFGAGNDVAYASP